MRQLYCNGDQTHFSPVIEPRREVPAACALSDSGGVALAASICVCSLARQNTDNAEEFVSDRVSVFRQAANYISVT